MGGSTAFDVCYEYIDEKTSDNAKANRIKTETRNSQAHGRSTDTQQHQSSFHTHTEILHIYTMCPTFLA